MTSNEPASSSRGSSRRSAAKFTCAVSVLLALTSPAAAQTNPSATPTARSAAPASRLFRDGKRAYASGDAALAHRLYSEAWQLEKSVELAANLGQVELELGHVCEAVQHLAYALFHERPSRAVQSPAVRAEITRLLDDARRNAATLRLIVQPPDSLITLDGSPRNAIELSEGVCLTPGAHELEIRRDGYLPATRTVHLKRAETVRVTQKLVQRAPPAPTQVPVPATTAAPEQSLHTERGRATSGQRNGPEPARVESSSLAPAFTTLLIGAPLAIWGVGLGLSNTTASNTARLHASQLAGPGCMTAECAHASRSLWDKSSAAGDAALWSYVLGAGVATGTLILSSAQVSQVGNPAGAPLRERRSLVPVVIGGGMLLASATAGTWLTLRASGTQDEIEATDHRLRRSRTYCSSTIVAADCGELWQQRIDRKRDVDLATTAFVAAGTASLGTLIYWFWPAVGGWVRAEALVSPQRAGVTVRGAI